MKEITESDEGETIGLEENWDLPLIDINQEVLQQLKEMGFPTHICKKAIMKSNNEGLDKALDLIFEIKAEED